MFPERHPITHMLIRLLCSMFGTQESTMCHHLLLLSSLQLNATLSCHLPNLCHELIILYPLAYPTCIQRCVAHVLHVLNRCCFPNLRSSLPFNPSTLITAFYFTFSLPVKILHLQCKIPVKRHLIQCWLC